MEPQRPEIPSAETLAALERYVVEGERALADPTVAEAVAAHGVAATELARAMEVLRQPIQVPRDEGGNSVVGVIPQAAPRWNALSHGDVAQRGGGKLLQRRMASLGRSVGRFSRSQTGLGDGMLRRWVWHAGGIALLAVIAAFFMTHSVQPSRELRTYATATGQRASLLLDDGTHIMLAPQTTLRLIQFNQNVRTVMLDGDAYFEVAPSAHIPFVVQTGATTTRVLGTAFAVRHYADDADVRIAVATGKVIVSTGTRHPAVSVTAGQVASVTDSTPVVKKVDDLDTEIGWLGDRLVFQDAPMSKVLATLKRWYGYEFRVTDSTLIQQSVTIGLSIRSSAAALASLEQILDVNLTVVGDTVTLVPVHRHTESNQRSKHYDVWVPTREIGR